MDMNDQVRSLAILLLVLGAACGDGSTQPSDSPGTSDGDDGQPAQGDGESTDGQNGTTEGPNPDSTLDAPWSSHCTATATRAFQATDPFGDPTYQVKKGDEFVLGGFRGVGSLDLVALTDAGPVSFSVTLEDGDTSLDVSCDPSETKTMIGVFADVTLYLDDSLTMEACSLEAGTIADVGEDGFGYGGGGAEGGFTTYQLSIAGLASKCGGHSEVYARVPRVEVDGVWHDLIPILGFETLGD